jgi:hypothetical protein
MSWDIASIYPDNFHSWCHLFCEVHQSLLQQSAAYPCVTVAIYFVKCTSLFCSKAPPTRASQLGWCSSACKPPPFSPNIMMGITAKQFYFCFIRPEDSFYCGYRYFCTGFLQHLCCCSEIDLHFSHQSTFISRRQNASPLWVVWRLRGPMVFILAYYCLPRWMWYLQAFGNCSQGWTRLVEGYNSFSEVLADFF